MPQNIVLKNNPTDQLTQLGWVKIDEGVFIDRDHLYAIFMTTTEGDYPIYVQIKEGIMIASQTILSAPISSYEYLRAIVNKLYSGN